MAKRRRHYGARASKAEQEAERARIAEVRRREQAAEAERARLQMVRLHEQAVRAKAKEFAKDARFLMAAVSRDMRTAAPSTDECRRAFNNTVAASEKVGAYQQARKEVRKEGQWTVAWRQLSKLRRVVADKCFRG